MSLSILIITAEFNELITRSLHQGALDYLSTNCETAVATESIWVPGAFEIPIIARQAALSGRFDAIVTLGAIIKGETPHFDFIASQCTSALMAIATETGVPVAFGILTTNTVEEAMNRAGLKLGNKGREAASTALRMAALVKSFDKVAAKSLGGK